MFYFATAVDSTTIEFVRTAADKQRITKLRNCQLIADNILHVSHHANSIDNFTTMSSWDFAVCSVIPIDPPIFSHLRLLFHLFLF